jgi:6-phosphofructokinase 1
MPRIIDETNQRPKKQWWLDLRPIAKLLAQPGPSAQPEQLESAEKKP